MVPEIQGNYSWFSLRRDDKIVPRAPWHQLVYNKEAQDVFKKAEELKEAGLAAAEFGLDVNIEDLDAISNLLKPDAKYDENGQKVFFMQLW